MNDTMEIRGFTNLSALAYRLADTFANSPSHMASPLAYPYAAVIMAITFVDSYFSEQIAIFAGEESEVAEGKAKFTHQQADELKGRNIERKLDEFLAAFGRSWNKGCEPYQSFKQILTLRHQLVHYKPKFQPITDFPNPTIEQIAQRFPHPYLGRTPWSATVLTPQVAAWACKTAKELVREFHSITGTTSPWETGMPGWEDHP